MKFNKFIVLITALISVGFHCKCQTLTAQDNNPQIGEKWQLVSGDYVAPGNPGQNMVWNFSTLTYTPWPAVCIGTDPSLLSSNYTISTASNFAWTINDVGGHYFNDANGVELLGQGSGSTRQIYSDSRSILKYPFSLGSSFSDTYSFVSAPNTPNQLSAEGSIVVSADGTGTLILPSGTYTNTLRIRTLETYTTVSANGTLTVGSEQVQWFTPGIHTELLTIYSNTNLAAPNLTGIRSLAYRGEETTVGIPENGTAQNGTIVFNSYSKDLYLIKNINEPAKIELFNCEGQKLIEKFVGEDNTLSMEHLPNGIYVARLHLNNKTITKKIVVF